MYQNNSKTQQDVCLICFEPLLKSISFIHLLYHFPLCSHCLDQFSVIHKTIQFYHYPLHILYEYNDFFKSLLYQYKGLYDYALKDTFLCLFHQELYHIYKDYTIVVAPSSDEDNLKRGFAPMETIAKTLSNHVFTGLYKKEKYKQSDMRYEERMMVKEKISIRNGNQLRNKKVLILDDVLTSGNTLFSCLSLVLQEEPETIELMVLSTGRDLADFKT